MGNMTMNRPGPIMHAGVWRHLAIWLALLWLAAFAMAGNARAAAPLAGTIIGNQASATYTDSSGTPRSATSNLVQTEVQLVPSFLLTQNQTLTGAPGQTLYFPHTIANTGNGTDSFALSLPANTLPAGTTLAIYADNNGDGIPDNFTAITNTGNIPAGGQAKFIVAVAIPATASIAAPLGTVTVRAVGVGPNGSYPGGVTAPAAQTNTDTVNTSGNAVVNATKSVNPASGPAGGTVTYTITLTNTGNDGAANLLVTEILGDALTKPAMAKLVYVANSVTVNGVAVADAGSASIGTLGNVSVTKTASNAGFKVDVAVASLAKGQTATVTLQATVAADAPVDGSASTNTATLAYDDKPSGGTTKTTQTNPASYTPTPAVNTGVRLADDANEAIAGYDAPASITDQDAAANDVVTLDGTSPAGAGVYNPSKAYPGSVLFYQTIVKNTGNGTDSFDMKLAATGTFPAGTQFEFVKDSGANTPGAPLLDTNGNGTPDTGPVAVGATAKVWVKVTLPSVNPSVGSYDATVQAASFISATPLAGESNTNSTTLRLLNPQSSVVDLTNQSGDGSGSSSTLELLSKVSCTAGTTGSLPNQTTVANACAVGTSGVAQTDLAISKTANPGQTVVFPLKVQNAGGGSDSFDLKAYSNAGLSAALTAGWTVVFKQDTSAAGDCSSTGSTITNTGPVPTGQMYEACAVVMVPSGTVAGDYPLYFQAKSSSGTATSDFLHDQVTVNTIRNVAITPDSNGQTYPGGSVVYSHTLTNTGNVVEGNGTTSTVTIPAASVTNSLAGWSTVLYIDANGNGTLDPADILWDPTKPLEQQGSGHSWNDGLSPGESVTLLAKTFAPSTAGQGEVNITSIDPVVTGTINSVAAPDPTAARDTTQIIAGNLQLSKYQQLDANCDGTEAALSSGWVSTPIMVKPGECVVYKLEAINVGTANVSNLVITDATPIYTTVSKAAVCSVSGNIAPNPTTCSLASEPVVGATGTVQTGSVSTLQPSASVTVTFGVKLDQ